MGTRTNHTVIPAPTLQINTFYKLLIYRSNGRLKTRLFAVELYNQPNVVNITSQPNFRIGARTSNAGGTTHVAFTNNALAHLSIINGAVTPFTEAKLIADWDKLCANKYGL